MIPGDSLMDEIPDGNKIFSFNLTLLSICDIIK